MEEIIKFLGGTALLLGAVAWLIRELMKHLLNKDIEVHKNMLKHESEKISITYKEKIELYKGVFQPIIEFIILANEENFQKESILLLEKKKLDIASQLAMFAPFSVFNQFNELMDYLYDTHENINEYSYEEARLISLKLLSEIRRDIGIYNDDIIYKGTR